MNLIFDIRQRTADAVSEFWRTKQLQLKASKDPSGRGAVTGGKQMDGFLSLIRDACIAVGTPEQCIFDKNNYLPGFFRSSKDWDLIIISPKGKLIAAIELKSQVGSYGNNFNNRTEEALGSATDLWTAYREHQFPTMGPPWIGFLMLIGRDADSTVPVRNHENHYPVLPEFANASYIDRYRILCEKLVSERLYSSACLICSPQNSDTFDSASGLISVERFIHSLQGHLIGCAYEFNS